LNAGCCTFDQLAIDQKTQTIQYKGQNLQKNIIKFENQKTWISIAGLDQILGFKIVDNLHQIEVLQNKSRFIVNQYEKKGHFFLGETCYTIEGESFFSHPGYLPLRELMSLFRIYVSYNQKDNMIFCTALNRNIPCSVYGRINSLSPLELWITDSSEILIDLDDLLSNSFYVEMYKIHLSGRSVRIITKNTKYTFYDTEKLIQLITDEEENLIVPDQFSYFIHQNLDWKLIPLHRTILTDSPSLYIESRKKGFPAIIIMDQSSFSSSQDPIDGYYDMSNQTTSDSINIIQSELKNIRSLYFLSNLKF
jgi:hypothetical protein